LSKIWGSFVTLCGFREKVIFPLLSRHLAAFFLSAAVSLILIISRLTEMFPVSELLDSLDVEEDFAFMTGFGFGVGFGFGFGDRSGLLSG
jgi:hypothetical protein